MYGYIYKFTLIPTGKIYVGKRKSSTFDDKYFGSGKYWKPLIKQYGKENIKREILEWCETESSLNNKEKYWIKHLNSRDPNIGYNISIGGHNPILEGKDNAMYGKHHTESVRKRISEHHKGLKRNDEFKRKRSEFMSNKHWYNNGIEDKYFIDSEVPEGYVKGRLKRKPKIKILTPQDIVKQQVKNLLGEEEFKQSKKFIVNNGEYELLLPICPEGFQKGRLSSHNAKIGASNKGKIINNEIKLKLSKRMSGENNPMYGVHRKGVYAPTYGKVMSTETKKLISAQHKGRIWINNGFVNKLINPDDIDLYINNGFKKGRVKY